MDRRLFSLVVFLFLLIGAQTLKSQPLVPIVLNEFSASNTTGPVDNYGVLSDWVEILNLHTSAVSLNGYYLSNDKENLRKWKFPGNLVLQPGELRVIWLSGRDVANGSGIHANFTLDQCKTQWLSLVRPGDGGVMDSVRVLAAKAGHSWGRYLYDSDYGVDHWKLFTNSSYLQPNPTLNYYDGYTPKPSLFLINQPVNAPVVDTLAKVNAGGFYNDGAQIFKVKINGTDYDTINFPCFDIYYTLGGNYPTAANGWIRYRDALLDFITIPTTDIVRIISVPRTISSGTVACGNFLPSFCETNTYFTTPDHQLFDERFGVVSLSIDKADTSWFNSQGVPASTTVHVEYFDNKKQISEGYSTLNRPTHESWLTAQKGYYLSIDDRYGFGCNFEGEVFNVQELGTSPRKVFPTLHMKAGDHESLSLVTNGGGAGTGDGPATQGTALRDVLMQSLAAKYNLNVNPLHIKPVVAFVNGKYWGVYNLTEVFDKYYENFYNGQPLESLDMAYYYYGDASVSYPDGSVSTYSNNFKAAVYDPPVTQGLPLGGSEVNYNKVMSNLDRASFIDYMILNSYAMNSDLWNFNVAFARGYDTKKPGNKWHYYLWNMPTVFNYTATATNTLSYPGTGLSPCYLYGIPGYAVSPKAHNGHGKILAALFDANKGNKNFQTEYKMRYQDLMNGPLSCKNLLKQLDLIDTLYEKEMFCQEDPACAAGPGLFVTQIGTWDTNMVRLRKTILNRCYYMEGNGLRGNGCFDLVGPYTLTVNVRPAGSGSVKLNSLTLNEFSWTGMYFRNRLSFTAVNTNTNYVFDHWEFGKHTPNGKQDDVSITVDYAEADSVVAVFTDITKPINVTGEEANIPTAFTPNDDGLNEVFGPMGSAKYAKEYQMTIWNRWGQEVFRSTNPDVKWDGKYKGGNVPTGVYAYIITYKDFYGEARLAKGNVTLTR